MPNEFLKFLKHRGACKQARKWVKKHNITNAFDAWCKVCNTNTKLMSGEHPMWLVWLLRELDPRLEKAFWDANETSDKSNITNQAQDIRENIRFSQQHVIEIAYELQLANAKIERLEAKLKQNEHTIRT